MPIGGGQVSMQRMRQREFVFLLSAHASGNPRPVAGDARSQMLKAATAGPCAPATRPRAVDLHSGTCTVPKGPGMLTGPEAGAAARRLPNRLGRRPDGVHSTCMALGALGQPACARIPRDLPRGNE